MEFECVYSPTVAAAREVHCKIVRSCVLCARVRPVRCETCSGRTCESMDNRRQCSLSMSVVEVHTSLQNAKTGNYSKSEQIEVYKASKK